MSSQPSLEIAASGETGSRRRIYLPRQREEESAPSSADHRPRRFLPNATASSAIEPLPPHDAEAGRQPNQFDQGKE